MCQRCRRVLYSFLITLAMFAAGCQPAVVPSATVTPVAVTQPMRSATPAPTLTQPSPPTMSPTPVNTAVPATPEPAGTISGSFRMVIPVDDVLSGAVEALISTADGTVWLVTDQAVGKIVDDTLTVVLPGFTGSFAGIDSDGQVWVVAEAADQISVWDGQTWTTYGAEAGWMPLAGDLDQQVRGGQRDQLDRIWFTTAQDVRVFDGSRWTVYNPQAMGMQPPIYEDLRTSLAVTVSKNGMVWVSACDWGGPGPFGGAGVRWFEEGTWRGSDSPVASGCAIALAEDNQGHIWTGVDKSLWHYDPVANEWTEFSAPEPPIADMHFGFIASVVVDRSGDVWPVLDLCGGASCFGRRVLYHLHDGVWTQVGETVDYSSSQWGPIFEESGLPWLSWEGGIYRIQGDTLELASPLADRFGAVDSRGRVWVVAPYAGRAALWVLANDQ